MVNVISPCVTFNNGASSTKSYVWAKEHGLPLHDIGFIPLEHDEIQADYEPGTIRDVTMHDGSVIRLKKIGQEHDPTDRVAAITLLEDERKGAFFATGLLYVNEERGTLVEQATLVDVPLVRLPNEKLRPSKAALDQINAELFRF